MRAEAWAKATKVTTTLSFEPKAFGGTSDKIGGSACKLAEIDNEISAVVNELSKSLAKVRAIINQMPQGKERTLLIDRYTKYMSWPDIADDLNVSYRTRNVFRIKEKALIKVQKITEKVDNSQPQVL